MSMFFVVQTITTHNYIRYNWRRADAPAVRNNFGLGFQHISVARDRLQRMCNISVGTDDSFTPQRRQHAAREALAGSELQYNLISPVVLTKDAPIIKEARQPHPAGPLEARDRVAILTMPILLDRESQIVVELERHRAHLHLDILRLALGPFPSYLIDLLLGAAVGFAAHYAAACSVARNGSADRAYVSIEVAVVSSTGMNYCPVIYARS